MSFASLGRGFAFVDFFFDFLTVATVGTGGEGMKTGSKLSTALWFKVSRRRTSSSCSTFSETLFWATSVAFSIFLMIGLKPLSITIESGLNPVFLAGFIGVTNILGISKLDTLVSSFVRCCFESIFLSFAICALSFPWDCLSAVRFP